MTKCKEYGSIEENSIEKCVHTPYIPIPTNNRCDVLLNLRDCPSSEEDVVIQEIKNQKTRRNTRLRPSIAQNSVRFEVFTAMTMKNAIFWDVMPCLL
jgi:hypothetical protein